MKLNKTYMAILSTISFGCLFSYADINEFNVIISQDKSNYKVTDWIDTGNTRCNTISPLAEEIYKDKTFTQYHSNCEKEQQKNSDIRWIPSEDYTISKIGELLLENCSQILNDNHGTTNGVYSIVNNGNEIEVLCDMTTDGGGWTLVSYAGAINTSKKITTGKSETYYQPLIFNFGEIDNNALTNKNSFSRFDLFKNNAKSSDQILSRRTSSNKTNMLIFPLSQKEFFGRKDSEGHFKITSSNRNIPYLKMTNAGDSNWKTVTNNVKWSYVNNFSNDYPGIDWNVSEGNNCDNCGLNYNTGLNHRSLLYWQSIESVSDHYNQWFHGNPLSLKDSTGAYNSTQDIEFWYREI